MEKLRRNLSSPRLKAPGTITTYMLTAKKFLDNLPAGRSPTREDFQDYFTSRREAGISERTLQKEFYHLQKLAQANGWDGKDAAWNFTKDDVPLPKGRPHAPPLTRAELELLVSKHKLFSKSEQFYLAMSITFSCRREELSRIRKRDYNNETILIRRAHKNEDQIHLIPDAIKPVMEHFSPHDHNQATFNYMFQRICAKAGIEHKKGLGWHGVRRTMDTEIEDALVAKGIHPMLWSIFQGWSSEKGGSRYAGSPMAGRYYHPEIKSDDPYYIDRVVYSVNPFLKTWQQTDREITPPG